MMTLAQLTDFNKVHKKAGTYKRCPPEVIERYQGILPEILTATWKESGFQVFSEGFLWSVNPDEFRDVVAGFVHEYQIEDVHVIFRTAFGDMILSYRNKFYHFCAVTMNHGELMGSLNAILEVHLAEIEFLNSVFFFDLFKKAKKKLGEISEDEVYGFFPAIQAGGDLVVENLRIVNLLSHLHLLAQPSTG